MRRLYNALSGKKDRLSPVLILLLTALFFLLHYNVFFDGYYRSHGDFTGIHFSIDYVLNGIFQDLDIPVWQPYQGLGNVDILAYLTYHPLLASLSAAAQFAAAVFPESGYSFFKTTFFSFLLGYCATFAFGCYLLAKDFLPDRFARLSVFAMALFGTQISSTVFSVGPGIFYLPFIPLFLFRLLAGKGLTLNSAGLILSLGLFFSSTSAYLGQASVMLLLLFGAAALLRPWDMSGFKSRLAAAYRSPGAAALLTASAVLAAAMLTLKAVLVLRLPEFASEHRTIIPGASFIDQNIHYFFSVCKRLYTNKLPYLVENLVHNRGNFQLQGFSGFPRLYYGLLPVVALLFFWRRIKDPVLPLLLSVTLALFIFSCNPLDGYNFILPLMVFIDPLLSLSTRHLNFAVVFAAPFLILALGLALDALLRSKSGETGRNSPRFWAVFSGLLMVFASALMGNAFSRYCAVVIPLCVLIIFFPSGRFPKLRLVPGALVLLLILGELFIPFRNYTEIFYEPFGKEIDRAAQFGNNLGGPKMRGFPAPFRHSFSFWFDDMGQITTADNYPSRNNAAFKFFSGMAPQLLVLPGLFSDDMTYLRGNNERLFFVDSIIPAKDQEEGVELTSSTFWNGLRRSAAVVEAPGGEAGVPVPGGRGARRITGGQRSTAPPRKPEQVERSIALPASAFTPAGRDGKNPDVELYKAKLPAVFPPYLTSNFLNKDIEDVMVTGAAGVYRPTYFDIFDGENLFQANFRDKGGLTISGPPPAAGLTLRWKDRLGGLGLSVTGFGYNFLKLDAVRASRGLLVYMDRFHFRWRALIDGKPVKIYRTNGQFKGVFVPEGRHEIEFKFHDPVLKLALLISTLAHLLGIAALFVLCARGAPPGGELGAGGAA